MGADELLQRISCDPDICHGQACIRGTRIPVHQLLRMLANGDTVADLVAQYPGLHPEDVQAALQYAAELVEDQVIPIDEMRQP